MNWEGIHWIGWLKKGSLSTELLLIVRSSEPRRQNKFGIRDDQLFKLRSECPTYDQLASSWTLPLTSISLSTTNIESRLNYLGGDKPLEISIHSPVGLGASASSQIAQIQLVPSVRFASKHIYRMKFRAQLSSLVGICNKRIHWNTYFNDSHSLNNVLPQVMHLSSVPAVGVLIECLIQVLGIGMSPTELNHYTHWYQNRGMMVLCETLRLRARIWTNNSMQEADARVVAYLQSTCSKIKLNRRAIKESVSTKYKRSIQRLRSYKHT